MRRADRRLGLVAASAAAWLTNGCVTGPEIGRASAVEESIEESTRLFPDAVARVQESPSGVVTVEMFDLDETTPLGELEWDVANGTAVWSAGGESTPVEVRRDDRAETPLAERASGLAYDVWRASRDEAPYFYGSCCYHGAVTCLERTCYSVQSWEYDCWDVVVCIPGAECAVMKECGYRWVSVWICEEQWIQCGGGAS